MNTTVTPSDEPTKLAEKPEWISKLEEADNIGTAFTLVHDAIGFKQTQLGAHNDGLLALLGIYLSKNHVTWSQVSVKQNETSFGKAFKNIDKEIGKRLCVSGTIVQINEGSLINEGLLSSNGNLYHFGNFGDSGDLESMSYARMCGFVVGLFDYKNSGGGTGHAVELIGVWDLPENKKK